MIKLKKYLAALAVGFFLLGLPVDLLARGYGGGGGSRGGGGFRGSSSFSSHSYSSPRPSVSSSSRYGGGSSSSKAVVSTPKSSKPSYDVGAGQARQHEMSRQKFDSWKNSQGISEPKTYTFNSNLATTRDTRTNSAYSSRQPTGFYTPRSTTTIIHYRDPYDDMFLRHVSYWWLFHHWDHVDHSRFDEVRLQELERKFAELKAQGNIPDSNYQESGIDPDLAYKKEAAYHSGHPVLKFFLWIIVIGGLVWVVWFIFIRRVKR